MNENRLGRLLDRVDTDARVIIEEVGDADHQDAWAKTLDLRDMLKAALIHIWVYQESIARSPEILDHFMMDYPRDWQPVSMSDVPETGFQTQRGH